MPKQENEAALQAIKELRGYPLNLHECKRLDEIEQALKKQSAGPTPRSGPMPAHEPLPTEGAEAHCWHECVCTDYGLIPLWQKEKRDGSCNIAFCDNDTRTSPLMEAWAIKQSDGKINRIHCGCKPLLNDDAIKGGVVIIPIYVYIYSRPLGMVGAPDAPAGASVGAVSEDCRKKKE